MYLYLTMLLLRFTPSRLRRGKIWVSRRVLPSLFLTGSMVIGSMVSIMGKKDSFLRHLLIMFLKIFPFINFNVILVYSLNWDFRVVNFCKLSNSVFKCSPKYLYFINVPSDLCIKYHVELYYKAKKKSDNHPIYF
uniref:Uncharacterized protein n=1 Tax=Timema shepardi TaxID=629360 RepID=A0A7R9G7V2_TIMSH|nr:unnamed protein product [Timema shepardi]